MEKKSEKHVLSFFVNLLLVILTFISTIYLGVFINSKRTLDSELENRGRSIVDSIVMARNWGAHYGGVYVEKSPGVISNPYLKNPDFEAVDGRIYTKKNPALMVREISEMARKNGAFEFRITSLLPLNPDNAPDVFEKGALEKFEKGEEEVFIKEHFEESTFFRYMAPLIMEDSCLSCHGEAYSVGDIRGGISVRFNIDAVEAALVKNIFIVLGLALLTLLSLFAIIYRLVAQLKRRLRQAEVKLREMASTDELTGLKNRRYLGERLHVEFKQARRYARTISCIMFDLDDFKRINDTLGHDAGDEVLRAVGHVTKSVCRETDIPSRFGGDEFVIILPDTDLRGGVETAERLHRAISSEKIRLPDGGVLTFTASFGVASTESLGRHDANEEASLLKRADDALYRAKGRGRNCVEKDDLECTGNALRIKSLASS